jgi:hypothetical protein
MCPQEAPQALLPYLTISSKFSSDQAYVSLSEIIFIIWNIIAIKLIYTDVGRKVRFSSDYILFFLVYIFFGLKIGLIFFCFAFFKTSHFLVRFYLFFSFCTLKLLFNGGFVRSFGSSFEDTVNYLKWGNHSKQVLQYPTEVELKNKRQHLDHSSGTMVTLASPEKVKLKLPLCFNWAPHHKGVLGECSL